MSHISRRQFFQFSASALATLGLSQLNLQQQAQRYNPPGSAADAVITEVKGNQAKLWLGGIDVDAIAPGTVFNIINGQG